MKGKIKKYINAAEKDYLEGVAEGIFLSAERLCSRLDLFVIPCVSMTKDDNLELEAGLSEMLKKHQQQTKLDF